jgi:DNA primase
MDAVEEVKSRLNIEDVIGQYVQLKRAGRNFKGLSPFTSEKTASFIVSPEKQIWHDFSSGKGGNLFSFVMELEGLDFKGALELLARQAGVDLDKFKGRSGGNAKLKQRLIELNDLAARFYQTHLSRSKSTLDYVLKQRRFNKTTVLQFRLGYSPNNGTALYDFLSKKGFSDQEIQRAGLVTKRYSKPVDMFRGRLMVPLMDPQGQVVGFTARLLEDEPNSPKYINTPQTLLYDKSRHVFGLNLAKENIRREGFAVTVEGNLDVIASHQIGVSNVVATAGTALTEQHLKTIGRFASDIRLAFDADKAGLAATERAIPIASRVGVSLSIVTLDDAKDPDELIQKNPKAWEKVISKPQYALDWLIDRYQAQLDLSSGQGKRAFSDALLPTLRGLSDPVEQDHYFVEIAKLLDVSPSALREKLQKNPGQTALKKTPQKRDFTLDQQQLEWAKAQDHLLALTLMRPPLRDLLDIVEPEMLPQESARELLEYLQNHPDFDGNLSHAPLLHQITDYVKILSLQYEALFVELDEVEARYEAHRLRVRLIEIFVKTKKAQIAAALKEADDDMARKLLTRARALDSLLKSSREA